MTRQLSITDESERDHTEAPSPPWYYAIEPVVDPWLRWTEALPEMYLRNVTPLTAWLEWDIDAVIEAADKLRISTVPSTPRFAAMWSTFCHHHRMLEDCYDYRRDRYLVWRAAALTVLCDRGRFQDCIDFKQAKDALAATFDEFYWHGYALDGTHVHYPEINFWRPGLVTVTDGAHTWQEPDALPEYAAMVLILARQARPS